MSKSELVYLISGFSIGVSLASILFTLLVTYPARLANRRNKAG